MPRAVNSGPIKDELDAAVRLRFPELPEFYTRITKYRDHYSAIVVLQNKSKDKDGNVTYHGELTAVFERKGQWICTRDFRD